MPNIKSAKKRVKVQEVKRLRNKSYNSALKTAVKAAHVAIETSAPNGEEAARAAMKKLDQSVSKGILHKNTAARKKSAIALKLNQSKAGSRS